MKLQPGLLPLLSSLSEADIPQAIVTRNNAETLHHFLERFKFDCFNPTISREFTPCKPAPDSALHICAQWGVDPSNVLFVGDGIDGMCGIRPVATPVVMVRCAPRCLWHCVQTTHAVPPTR
jgi:HAD superfamily hydrolase (TIGR01509 family)